MSNFQTSSPVDSVATSKRTMLKISPTLAPEEIYSKSRFAYIKLGF